MASEFTGYCPNSEGPTVCAIAGSTGFGTESKELRMRLQGKTAVITGGNSGIGLATARLFVAEGARVAIIGRNPQTLDAAAKELGKSATALNADVSDYAAMEKALAEAHGRFGGFDVLFANAGIGLNTPVGGTHVQVFEEVLRTNLIAVFFTVQAALPYLKDGASIVLNGSVVGVSGSATYSAYAASKAGVRAMARSMAAELSPRGIRVNVVVPGGTRTPIWSRHAATEQAMTALEQRLSMQIPLRRLAEPSEIAKAVLFLASDEASYVQGTELVADGGATGAPFGAPIYRVPAQ
jgi:NAD(P)-dependent dehydrogenase (short-subunit alcohol dehydrogenase family)